MIRSRITLLFICSMMMLCSGWPISAATLPGPDRVMVPVIETVVDTIPIEDRYGDYITNGYYNPFDIKPSIIEQTVEYDFETQKYVVMEKIGDEYYRTPTYLTLTEYLEWQERQQEKNYFDKLSGNTSREFTSDLQLDPMSEIDVSGLLIDRMFGGNGVDIKPTGNVDLIWRPNYSTNDNPQVPADIRTVSNFMDIDMDINVGVEAKIGEKLNLGFNYNSNASFDFDNKLNLGYGSDLWDEDDIIKNIEAGDVDFTVPGQLIQGQQNLFGLKTELQFGKFWLTAVASQSRSEKKKITLENGKLIQEFELFPDDYDENRHFFLAHYFRDTYNDALSNIPQVRSLVRITNLEVWVTNDINNDLSNTAQVVGIDFLGESELENFSNPDTRFQPAMTVSNGDDVNGIRLPSNENSDLFEELINDVETKNIDVVRNRLQGTYGLKQARDFEIQNMRKLNANEYTYNPELGYISLTQRLRSNQVLAVAYEYTYTLNGSKVYKVGQMTNETVKGAVDEEGEPEPEDVIYVKLLKSTNQIPNTPSWDLMMKNVYSLNTSQLTQEDFQFDIFFQNNNNSALIRYLPEQGFRNIPLLNLFQLDRLNRYSDPQEDGVFDFINGITVNARTGSVIFPVLEPYGAALRRYLGSEELYDKYGYPELYTNTVTQARLNPEKNRFMMKGQVKSNFSSEIYLGAFEIPRGSLVVRAGSQILKEGIDYDVDYGFGRLKILNQSYIQQGVPIDITFEDQGLFNLQQKTMFGLRGEYRFNDNFTIGGTYMRLFERPFTQKVNHGEDPINNRMFGLDVNYATDAPGITRFLDRLPLLETDAESSFSISAEMAALKPGHSGAINTPGENTGLVSLDDFEGANSGIPLGSQPDLWSLASPPGLKDNDFLDNTYSGVNRALMSWYVFNDRQVATDQSNPYTRRIDQTELFDREVDPTQIPDLRTFDITYYPDERGPYNFDVPGGVVLEISDLGAETRSPGIDFDPAENRIVLNDPQSRWGGIMRYLPNNDFESANYEYIEFWMLNPFMDVEGVEQPNSEEGLIIFQLGNISEDILRDGLQYYENSIPVDDQVVPTTYTAWGRIPTVIPRVPGFNRENITVQDIGLDGLDDEGEREQYADYLAQVQGAFNIGNLTDVANDNFVSYLNPRFDNNTSLLERYKYSNNPQGNAPVQSERINVGKLTPDTEDLNGNRSLETNESYYEYRISLQNLFGEINVNTEGSYITDVRTLQNPSTGQDEKWYRFQIPLNDGQTPIGDIQGFRSIQFMRMIAQGFEQQKTFRLAEFELVRNQWRRLPLEEGCSGDEDVGFSVTEVGIQENQCREPFNYVQPKGVKLERIQGTFANILQDENSLALQVNNIADDCEMMMSKLTRIDINRFDNLQMFVHAEEEGGTNNYEDGDLSVFIRVGKDFENNYYEYELPLKFSDVESARQIRPICDSVFSDIDAYRDIVWPEENFINFPLEDFRRAKMARNAAGVDFGEVYEYLNVDTTGTFSNGKIRIKGSPTLGLVKAMIIGVRNTSDQPDLLSAEVWVNELRLQGLDNRGGMAATVRADLQLADFGNLTSSLNYSSIGFGQIHEQLLDRSLEEITEFDIATNLELGKLLPKKWGVNVPFYYQYSNSKSNPLYDPIELDLTKEQMLANENLTEDERIEVEDRFDRQTTINTYNFTNVRKNKTSEGTAKPWDISNVAASYSYTKTTSKDEIVRKEETVDQRGELTYGYNNRAKPIQPFKKVKSKGLRFIREFNFNPVPTSFTFSTQLNRFKSSKLFRLPDPSEGFEYVFDDQRFTWDRNYALSWDLAKSLKLNFSATANAVVDELKQVGVAPTAGERRWVDVYGASFTQQVESNPSFVNQYRNDNLRDFGRIKNYYQGLSVSYNLPFKYLPGLDWISAQAQYNGDYTWSAGSLTAFDQDEIFLGNVIQNTQRRSLKTTLDFEKLYDKVGYFRKLEGKRARRSSKRGTSRSSREEESSKGSNEASAIEKILVRPLLMLREVKFNYTNDRSTVIPGYEKTPKLFGLDAGDPGWSFVFGGQPELDAFYNDVLLRNEQEDDLLTVSRFQNQQVLQNNTQNLQMDLEVEPWRDFKIDIDFKKTYTQNHSEYIINTSGSDVAFQRLQQRDFGGFTMTYMALNTLFDNDVFGLFRRFENNREVISNRLPNEVLDSNHAIDEGYAKGYGRQHVDVLVPAFLAAYTNQDPATVSLDLIGDVSKGNYIPAPNWTLRYDGLSNLPGFKKWFDSFSLRHGYKNTLGVSSFQTDLQYQPENQFFIDPLVATANYFARFEVPEIMIDERFEPIIGIDFKTKSSDNSNSMTVNLDYSKSRNLQFFSTIGQLTESRSTSFTIGMGWTLQDVNIGFLTGRKKRSRRPKRNTDPDNPDDSIDTGDENKGGILNRGGVNKEANRLEFTFDLRYARDRTWIHDIDLVTLNDPTRGLRSFTLSPQMNYDVNKNFQLSLEFNYSNSKPETSNAFERTEISGGLIARFILD